MFAIIGFVVVIGSVIGGYVGAGGHLDVLWQPLEFLIIFGAGLGAFLVANDTTVLKGAGGAIGTVLKGPKYKKAAYVELLGVLYAVFKLAKTKGDLALEAHVEKPAESAIFNQFPTFSNDHHAVDFLCDYLRMLTLGASNAHELENAMEQELEVHHAEQHAISSAYQTFADSAPALGIVAAVLGVIHTMGSITEPPEVLGHLIGGALVGTFSGILVSYGFLAPMASSLGQTYELDGRYLNAIRAGIIAHVQGYAPQVSVEFARKALLESSRPTFYDVENAVSALPAV